MYVYAYILSGGPRAAPEGGAGGEAGLQGRHRAITNYIHRY